MTAPSEEAREGGLRKRYTEWLPGHFGTAGYTYMWSIRSSRSVVDDQLLD